MTRRPVPDRDDDGFTLVELLVTVMLLGIVMTALMTVVVTVQRTQVFQVDTSVSMDETRKAMDRMRTEVRAARRVETTSTATRLDVWVDRDQDGIQDTDEQVTYEVAGTVLHRYTQAEPSPVVVGRHLTAPSGFVYDNPAPNFETRVVTMTLTAAGPQHSSADSLTLSAEVRLRNVAVPS